MHDVNNTVALVGRLLGERAVEAGDMGLLRTIMKFFNTFLRATINARDVRTAYNVLNQYRLLTESVLRAGDLPVVARVRDGWLVLDPRTLTDDDAGAAAAALRAALDR
jgi:hypothetical protein